MITIATFNEDEIKTSSDLRRMFRARAEVFRDRLHWDVHVEHGLEIDRYDRLHDPVYLLCHQDGMLVGSLRLLPTTGETMLKNEFRTMFDEPVDVVGATIWEGTRFCVHPCAKSEQSVSRELFIGMHETAYTAGVEHIVGLYDARMTRIYRRIGWTPVELARTVRPRETLLVGLWEVGRAALEAMRSREAVASRERAA